MNKARVELTIQGRVQGVFYRQSTREKALQLGLTGWIKNNADGSVTAVFEGEIQAIEQAVRWCEQGPAAAQVSEVASRWQEFQDAFQTFAVHR